jgi:hypothetical protein
MKIDLKANEMVVKATDSNYLLNKSTKITGKLILTNQRIYFKSTNGHTGKYDLEIDPKSIKEVMFFNPGIFVRSGLSLIISHGDELKFTLKNRSEWGQVIAGLC